MCCFNSAYSIETVLQWYVNGNEGRGVKAILVVDLKQTDCQIFLQQRWVYLGSAKNYTSESATIASHL